MKNRIFTALMIATVVAMSAGCGEAEAPVSKDAAAADAAEDTTDAAAEDTKDADSAEDAAAADTTEAAASGDAEEDAVSADEAEDLVTIADVYAANEITDVLSRHSSVTVEYQSKEGTDDILGTATYQITYPEDGNTEYTATMDNGEDIYDIQSYQNDSYIYTYNETTKEGAAGFLHPEDYISFIQKESYLPSYDTYSYSNIRNGNEDGALIVYADIDDVGQVYMWVDPESHELWATNYIFTSGVSTSCSITYDDPADLGISVLDEAKAEGTTTLTVDYSNSSYSEDYDYEIPSGTDVSYVGIMGFDIYTDETCSDDSYARAFTVGDAPMTVYAKYVE